MAARNDIKNFIIYRSQVDFQHTREVLQKVIESIHNLPQLSQDSSHNEGKSFREKCISTSEILNRLENTTTSDKKNRELKIDSSVRLEEIKSVTKPIQVNTILDQYLQLLYSPKTAISKNKTFLLAQV